MKAQGDFLLEVGCEEIPSQTLPRACEEFKRILENLFAGESILGDATVEVFGAPRRIAAAVRGLQLRQADTVREVIGPPKNVGFDNVGQPTRAAESFAAKQGVAAKQLEIIHTPKGEYLVARKKVAGRASAGILAEIVPRAIREIGFPRSMYWGGAGGPRFVRPVRWILCLLDGRVVPFEFAGVNSSNRTVGHRFLGAARIRIRGIDDYFRKLRKNFVLVQPAERRRKIVRELRRMASRRGWRVHQDPALLEQAVYLNEFPSVILGDFDSRFLELPDEILVTVMRDHQKYFALENRSGDLVPHFLAVMNLAHDRAGLVRSGHQRVLTARFADAKFFWSTDQKCRLADYLPKLAQVTYESRLGSYRDKTERIRAVARWLAEQWFSSGERQADVAAADRAAELAKCDLVTEMVREFPELQGIVGGLYARAQGEPEEVSQAIYDQYRPVGLDDPIPQNVTGCAIALADKLDSLVSCFGMGLVPSGSSDPFALRRAALGVVKILLDRKLALSLSAAVSAAAKALADHAPRLKVQSEIETQALEFVLDRAAFVLRERLGFAYDEVNAGLRAGADDLVDAVRRLGAIRAIRRTRNFAPLVISFKRIRNILDKAGKLISGDGGIAAAVRPELFRERAERELHDAARKVAARVGEHKRAGRYREALETIAELRGAVDRFFDDVLVMAEDAELRRNRLLLLAELLREFSTIADFSEIVVPGER